MVKEFQYTSIRMVLDNLLDHPLLRDVTLEQAIRYALRFMSLHGYSKLYQDKIADVEIHQFRGELPCDLISIIQVKDMRTDICLRSMTDSFTPGLVPPPPSFHLPHEQHPNAVSALPDASFKTQGRVIYVSFPEGLVQIAYKSIPVDENGFPLLIDNETFLAALEAYIKKQVFTVKFETGKIAAGVLQNAQREYAILSKELEEEFTTPSYSEAEAMSRFMTSLIPRVREFEHGFRNLGNREYLRNH